MQTHIPLMVQECLANLTLNIVYCFFFRNRVKACLRWFRRAACFLDDLEFLRDISHLIADELDIREQRRRAQGV